VDFLNGFSYVTDINFYENSQSASTVGPFEEKYRRKDGDTDGHEEANMRLLQLRERDILKCRNK
jgi:hypothetical protein